MSAGWLRYGFASGILPFGLAASNKNLHLFDGGGNRGKWANETQGDAGLRPAVDDGHQAVGFLLAVVGSKDQIILEPETGQQVVDPGNVAFQLGDANLAFERIRSGPLAGSILNVVRRLHALER